MSYRDYADDEERVLEELGADDGKKVAGEDLRCGCENASAPAPVLAKPVHATRDRVCSWLSLTFASSRMDGESSSGMSRATPDRLKPEWPGFRRGVASVARDMAKWCRGAVTAEDWRYCAAMRGSSWRGASS